jgi:O-acetyl-ADP-ribose deacetylase (regulator of RNase III)
MEKEFSGVKLEIITGDISAQADVQCVVNAANAQLLPGGGVAGAIHRGAGPGLAQECRPLAPISPGQAVITGGHDLPNEYVVHCLGPIYGINSPSEELLADCYRNAIRLAEGKGIESIAFPSISTGVFGYPMADASETAFRTILQLIPNLRSVKLIRFVLFGTDAATVHEETLASFCR